MKKINKQLLKIKTLNLETEISMYLLKNIYDYENLINDLDLHSTQIYPINFNIKNTIIKKFNKNSRFTKNHS